MKKLLLLLLILAAGACKEKVTVLPVQRTLNGTEWKKYEFRNGDREVFKILSFRAPNIVNISVRDDHGYLVNNIQEEYTYIYEHPNFRVDGPWDIDFRGRFLQDNQIEFQGETFLKSK
ncbi:hypothetical protein ACN9ML_18460 [Dyadobacter endophyticus]|uniref:hypothetical protein n=1 Tax=Dyadobacter endophyticus TaxID=1749036 RepID=UPI003CE8430F